MNEQVLTGKTAFITGAGSGIGRAAAQLFARHGARVAAVEIDAASGAATVAGLHADGSEALFLQADVCQASAVEHAFQTVLDRWGRLDVLFNVVGASGRRWGDGPVAECTEEGWDRVLEVNLRSMFLCCKYGVQALLASGGGSVVNLSSVLGLVGGDEDFATHAYAASKGGIISLTRAIASYYAPRHIRANVLCPGLIATGMSQRAQGDARLRSRLATLQPLTSDFGQPDDVAHAALFLASDQARFITGAVLTVDGGWTMR
jgi:NAD(P)-dependent dehydrogenase (short-subunit alcohol dehydrogenase family)